jgi:DNA polymerase III subunit alpha
MPHFVHLRLHSEYSVSDGIVRIEEACELAAVDSMPALALTDLANVFGMVKFYQAARAKGIKPILGCDVWISNASDRDKPSRLLLLVQNREGYLHLCDWLSRAFLTNQHRGRAEISKAWIHESGSAGLIALSGAQYGDVGAALLVDHSDAATRLGNEWAELFPNRYYIEIQRAGHPQAEMLVQQSIRLASRLQIPVVATHPVQFLRKEEFIAHEARVCIAEGYVLSDRRRPRPFTEEQYFKSKAEMASLFADLPQALENSVEIAKRCNFSFDLGKARLPLFPTPKEMPLDQYLREHASAGLATRMQQLYSDAAQREQQLPRYRERLEFEIQTIVQMGFPGYFLIVADFINWAKSNGVPVGPGRGSGAGSLVAYSLGITDLDPLRYDLLFERFLNPERVSMPDFDIDFCQDGRDRVIDYVRQKYGAESVSQIATFGTMAAKAVVRDVGRVMEWNYGRTDELAKLIPFQPGKLITLKDAREMEPRLKEREQSDEETRELLALAEQLEGLTRNVGMHAGGVLIAPGKLSEFCPLYTASTAENVISQLDKDDVEAIGLVKFDFLGLTTLTILDWTLRFIKRLHPERELQLESLPLNDPAAYRVFQSANATAVFQFESRGMRDLLLRAKPDRFEDLIALVALFRPGPMELIPDFIRRKHGEERWTYLDPRLEPILAQTYGIMVYQEQVMQIAQVIGGYSLGAADLLRRAMGKKKPEEMALQRDIFKAGAVGNGVSARKAEELFDLMEKFAGYGFNKSHAAAYALIAYQTAYMKAHYPAPFLAANLSAVMDDTDKVQQFYEDAVANKLEVLPPDLHASEYRFVPVDDKTIRYGLGAIKGTGEAAIQNIVEARVAGGPFRDLFDFCRRVDRRIVNRRVIESLVRAGAFDSLDPHRARLLASVGVAMEAGEQASRSASQVSLFADAGSAPEGPKPIEAARWDAREQLMNEKLALGFYYSGHPFESYRKEIETFARTRLGSLQAQGQSVTVAGIIYAIRTQQTKRGRMAVVVLDDATGRVEIPIFNELFEQHRPWLKEDQLLIVEGKAMFDQFTQGLRLTADRLYDLAAARNRFARMVKIRCNGGSSGQKLMQMLSPYRNGSVPVSVVYTNGNAEAEIQLGETWRVKIEEDLIVNLGKWLEPNSVEIVYEAKA